MGLEPVVLQFLSTVISLGYVVDPINRHLLASLLTDRLRRLSLCVGTENMTHLSIFSVVILPVSGQNSEHDSAHWLRLSLDQKVKVVRHEAVCVQKKFQLCLLYSEQ